MKYEPVEPKTREELVALLDSNDPAELVSGLYNAAYHDPEWRWVQSQCLRLIRHENVRVRWAAVTCLGDLAVFHRTLDLDVVIPAMEHAREDDAIRSAVDDSLALIRQNARHSDGAQVEDGRSSPAVICGSGACLVPQKTAYEAVKLLAERFPFVVDRSHPREDFFELAPPYHAYECFAAEIKARADDEEFVRRACDFINELAESRDVMLDEAVHIGTLESIACDADVARKVSKYLTGLAKSKLAAIERDMYGRDPS